MDKLTPQLNDTQLRQNIDALQKGGVASNKVQAYVDNYTRDSHGNYVLKPQTAPQPQTVLQQSNTNSVKLGEQSTASSALDQIVSGFKQTQKGAQGAQGIKSGIYDMLSGAGQEAAGGINLALSPLAALQKGIASIPVGGGKNLGDALNVPINAIGAAANKIPGLTDLINKYPGLQQDIPNLLTIATPLILAHLAAGNATSAEGDGGLGDFESKLHQDNATSAQQLENSKVLGMGDKTASEADLNQIHGEETAISDYKNASPATRPITAPSDITGIVKEGLSGVANKVGDLAGKTSDALSTASDIASTVKEGIKPSLTPEEATGQIIQGTPEDVAAAQRTFKSIDTSGVKTYADLKAKVDSQIKPLATEVDKELSKNTEGKSIKSYTQTVGAGKSAVKVNYVEKAIDDLNNYYTKTGDAQGLSDMKALVNKAKINGLTLKDINDLARTHGSTINAFNANGEAASGLTKQAAENTRMGLKNIARQGLGGAAAKALDAKLSDLYDTQALIDKMVKKVNASAQSTPKVGAIPKALGKVIKTVDTVAGSPLKAIGKTMGIGVNTTSMTPLEIESSLAKNLDILRGK